MTGASDSPLGGVALPAFAGIIAALGTKTALLRASRKRLDIVRGICVAGAIFVFSVSACVGLFAGAEVRVDPYTDITDLVDEKWESLDDESLARIHAFRARSRFADLASHEYETFMWEVVRPIVSDDESDRQRRLRTTLATMEAAFPKPESKADEKPKAEPAKEPAGEPAAKE
jgi:hypothetical protein